MDSFRTKIGALHQSFMRPWIFLAFSAPETAAARAAMCFTSPFKLQFPLCPFLWAFLLGPLLDPS